jgi:hypothetical protein
MSALDHAAVEVPIPAPARRVRRPRTTPARAAIAFAAAQVPLALIAIALEWSDDRSGSIVSDVVLYGSPISGPLQPQLIFLTLALLATRAGRRTSLLGTAGIAVMGVLVTINGLMAALGDAEHAPQAAATVGGIGFTAAGLTITAIAAYDLSRRRADRRS